MLISFNQRYIKALLWKNAYNLACRSLGVNDMRSSRYADVFTVSEEEVVEYVLKDGIPENEQTNPNLLQEGFHFYKEDGK